MLMGSVTSALPVLADSGALPATLEIRGEPRQDETTFITGMGLRALRARRHCAQAAASRARMLDFLERCQTADPPGAFAFWPSTARPTWAGHVPADADDTAICLAELNIADRLGRAETVRRVARLLLPNRVRHDGTLRPDWVPAGAFATWLVTEKGGRNIVDCAVNANILALLSLLGMRDPPGRREAVRLIHDGLEWAGFDATRLGALTPFYPEPAEFRLAVAHAVACGCRELQPAAARLQRIAGGRIPGPEATVCAAAYNRVGWRSPALAALRSITPAEGECPVQERSR